MPATNRILFVDDEPAVLNLLQMLFRQADPSWDCAFTDSGARALSLLADRPFDVIITDMRMPEMNGAELLEQVRERYPAIPRIVLSGYADTAMSLRALGSAHQHLSKPFTLTSLGTTIRRLFDLDQYIGDPRLREQLGRVHLLPSPASVHERLSRDLVSHGNVLDSLAGAVAQDPALSAKMLQLVHSSFFGPPKPLMLAKEAAQGLGVALMRSLAMNHRLTEPWPSPNPSGLDLDRLVQHSVGTGLRASRIMAFERALPDQVKLAFTAGLLHDIGKLALASILPEQWAECSRASASGPAAEVGVLGISHAQVGAYLLGLWGLPEAIVEVVGAHHEPRRHAGRGVGPLTAVHVANALESSPAGPWPGLDEEYLRSLKVDAQRFQLWRQVALGNG